jgi:zinc finger protein
MNTCRTSIPYFTDIVILSFTCDYCGHHTTDTKNSGEIGDETLMITLNVEKEDDLKRDLFKSETCYVSIPEVELELEHGTLGGVYTTVEGLLEKIENHMGKINSFVDSDTEFGQRMKTFIDSLY